METSGEQRRNKRPECRIKKLDDRITDAAATEANAMKRQATVSESTPISGLGYALKPYCTVCAVLRHTIHVLKGDELERVKRS